MVVSPLPVFLVDVVSKNEGLCDTPRRRNG